MLIRVWPLRLIGLPVHTELVLFGRIDCGTYFSLYVHYHYGLQVNLELAVEFPFVS